MIYLMLVIAGIALLVHVDSNMYRLNRGAHAIVSEDKYQRYMYIFNIRGHLYQGYSEKRYTETKEALRKCSFVQYRMLGFDLDRGDAATATEAQPIIVTAADVKHIMMDCIDRQPDTALGRKE